MLKDVAKKYYLEQNYNCAETIVHAANEYYDLGLHDRDMILVGGYGAGMQTGNTCGAILGAIAILSMKYVEAKAHESADIKPVSMMLTRKFRKHFESTLCCEIKPKFFSPEIRCNKTIDAACDIIEETLVEYEESKKA